MVTSPQGSTVRAWRLAMLCEETPPIGRRIAALLRQPGEMQTSQRANAQGSESTRTLALTPMRSLSPEPRPSPWPCAGVRAPASNTPRVSPPRSVDSGRVMRVVAADGDSPGDRLATSKERAGPLGAAATTTDPAQLRKGKAGAGLHRLQHLDRASTTARAESLDRLARPRHGINLAVRESAPPSSPPERANHLSVRDQRREKTLFF